MKTLVKQFILYSLFCFISLTNAQVKPTIKVGDKQLEIATLKINIDVIGNIATTTYDMQFYNPTNKILEGELNFPLGENQNVVRLALEINNNLREAVVVEKELGRVAFEAVVRRGVDPVLLEKVTGNNYKARIYPIPANGYKRIVLAYDQPLTTKNKQLKLYLPLQFNSKLDVFKLNIKIFNPTKNAGIKTFGFPINFIDTQHIKIATFTRQNFFLNNDLTIKIPIDKNTPNIIRDEKYFYFSKQVNFKNPLRNKPAKIDIFLGCIFIYVLKRSKKRI